MSRSFKGTYAAVLEGRERGLYALENAAIKLGDRGLFKEAADSYAVMSDLAEEVGLPFSASLYRIAMRRMVASAWAAKKWPGKQNTIFVRPLTSTLTSSEFRITVQTPEHFEVNAYVRVGRRNKVRRIASPRSKE